MEKLSGQRIGAGIGRGMGIGRGSIMGAGAGITVVVTDSRITPPPITLPSTLAVVLPMLPSTRASQAGRSAGC